MSDYVSEWINPKYVELVRYYDALRGGDMTDQPQTRDCSNCGGVGKIIYIDPNTNQPRDVVCSGCGGSGQVPA